MSAATLWSWDAAIFAASVLGLAAIWLGYPAVIGACAGRRAQRPDTAPARWPRVSIIVAAYNEAAHIAARLRNLEALDYPAGLIEVIVAEDGSEDGTAALVARNFPRVRLLAARARAGKAAALNRAAAAAQGEILLFTDANNAFNAEAVRHLVAPFADAAVGAVTGRKAVARELGLGGGESVYWRYEGWLTQQESACGGTVAGFGEALAVRRELFVPLPTGVMLNDDLYLTLQVLAQGRRVMAAPAARSFEIGAAGARAEWERRNRMMVGRWQALASLRGRWRALGVATGLKLLFHEILRPISALWLATALAAGLPLLAAPGGTVAPAWRALAWMQAGGWAWVAAVAAARRCGARLGRAEAPYFFCLALAAALGGWWRYLRHAQTPLWRRAERAEMAERAEPVPEEAGTGLLQGLFWAASSFLAGKGLVLASVMVLARLLAPGDFGAVALATSTVMMLEIFGTLGMTSAMIYEERDVDGAANVCFRVTLAAAAVETVLALAAAGWLAGFFHVARLAPMLRLMSACLVLNALGNTHDTLLRRRLAFRRKLAPDLAMAASKSAAAITLAAAGCGAWALIWGQLIGTLASTVVLWRVVEWRPGRRWNAAVARRMAGYGKHIYFLDSSSVILTNLDAFTIGRLLNASLLGFYTLAFRVPEVVLLSALNVVTRVVFPAFSRLQSDRAALRQALLETSRYTAMLTLPLATVLIVLAPEIVRGFYGGRWAAAAPVLRVLAICGGVRCLVHHFGDAYKAIGRPDVLSRVTWAWWLLLPPSLIVGAKYGGIVGVAWGEVATRVVMTGLHFFLAGRIVQISARRMWNCFAPTVEGCGILAAALLLGRGWVAGWDPRLGCGALTAAGALAYLGWMRWRTPAVMGAAVAQLRRLPWNALRAPARAAHAVPVAET